MDRSVINAKICLFLVNVCVYWAHVFAQEGFVSLACGRQQMTRYVDRVGIWWTPDDSYISTGDKSDVSLTGEEGLSLRYFPFGTKNCYTLPTNLGNRYLIRGTFIYLNYDGLNRPPEFDVAIDATIVFTVATTVNDTLVSEVIVTAQRDHLSYCLLSRPTAGVPIISSLELRPLPTQSYTVAGNAILKLLRRVDSGNLDGDVRYPYDPLDRIWSKESGVVNTVTTVGNVTVNTQDDHNTPPDSVLASARIADDKTRRFDYVYDYATPDNPFLVFLYFAELNASTKVGDRVFTVTINGVLSGNYDIRKLSQGLFDDYMAQFTVDANQSLVVTFEALTDSPEPPSLNAIEIYEVVPTANGTRDSEVQALMAVRDQFNFPTWSGDPCLPVSQGQGQGQGQKLYAPWSGVTCGTLRNVTTIIGLDLSNRSLTGQIPEEIKFLSNLKYLNFAYNNLSKLSDLSNLWSLTVLDLSHNQFQGQVPTWLGSLPNLQKLMLDHNQFSGDLPRSLEDRDPTNFTLSDSGNPLLHASSSSSKGEGTVLKTFVGSLVGVTAFLIIVAMAITAYCYHKRRAKVRPRFSIWTPDKSPGPTYVMKSPHQYPIDTEVQSNRPQELSLKEVEIVTGKFKSRIGEGGFGAVYYGTLNDGSAVAVKVRSVHSHQGTREFTTELDLLQQVNHENLVPLVGFCAEYQQQILIYPYMSNGSLHDRLYDKGAGRKPLDWQTRLSIVLGAARGLNFLHTGGERCIIHRDVKSSNILLDDSMRAKIADFGLSKYSPIDGESLVSTEVRGTAGYLDPEYYSTQQLTEKSDVFSFGIVLLETVCGREPLNIHLPRDEWSLLEWVRPYIKDSNIQQIVDPAISHSYTPESLWRVLEVALQSVEAHSSRRPTAAYIVRELEDALIIENNASQYMASIQSLDSLCVPSIEMKDFTGSKAPSSYPLTFPFEPSQVFSDTMDSPDPR